MKFDDIFKLLKEEDVPIKEFPHQEKLQSYLQQNDDDVSYDDIVKNTGISYDTLLDLHNDISLHFKNSIAPKVFFSAMIHSSTNNEEFKMFFQRPDVDLCLLCLFKISDTKKMIKNIGTPQYQFLYDNWKKYRGY